jgi:hypothetical protein
MVKNKIGQLVDNSYWAIRKLKKAYFEKKDNDEEDESSNILNEILTSIIKFEISQMTQEELDQVGKGEAGMPS